METASILVADDDRVALDLLVEMLEGEGYRVRAAPGGEGCLRVAEAEPFDLAIVDLRMPDVGGLELVVRLRALRPEMRVIIVTAFATVDTAIEAVRAGAYDYLSKPFRLEQITVVVRRALEAARLSRENVRFRQDLEDRYGIERLVGRSAQMVDVYRLVARVAALDTTVLMLGETGSGKERVARAIHFASPRAGRRFVVIDCAALPETLIESELFGHERGAFTGAITARRGLFESAAGGTCFLDEVGELPLSLQTKLLRLLQERAIRRVGSNELVAVDARVIAATNRDLRKLVEEGTFREDLFYRLNVVTITVPPLRERPDDIPLLAQHFLQLYAERLGKPVRAFTPEALALLCAHPWPGNVRELEHTIERAVALASADVLIPEDLPRQTAEQANEGPQLPSLRMTLEGLRRWYASRVLEDVGGNKVRAAEILGIDRATLYRMFRRQGREEADE